MILIADSGSTKCDWLLTDSSGARLGDLKTMGFNPLFQTSETIAAEIKLNEGLLAASRQIKAVYYYGAGVNSEEKARVVRRAITHVFPQAAIHIGHDLTAAAYATYEGTPCISAILGTGSNSCYFDGENCVEARPALGFILGDEGSGAYFGKLLITDFLYQKLPQNIMAGLETEHGLTKSAIFEAVYQKPRPNVYLAGFAPFIAKHQNNPHISQMLHAGFVHFITEHVLCYPNATQLPVHFVGSIAFEFKTQLQSAAKQCGIQFGNIIQQPIQRLLAYHVAHIFPKLLA